MILGKRQYELLEEKLKKLNRLRPISHTMMLKLRERFEIEMTYNSNAIEGNTLTLKETYWVIQEGITVNGKPLKDHLEAKNHKEALEFLYEMIECKQITISENVIKSLHFLILKNIDHNIAGEYRKKEVFISGSEHKPPLALDVPQKMYELMRWARKHLNKIPMIDFAAIIHHKFVHIHPFEDGNGRTGRLLMNLFLMQYGFPLGIIQKTDRHIYYKALQFADHNKYKPLTHLVFQSVLRSLNIYLNVLTPSEKKESYKLLSEISVETPYSPEYLNKLAKLGKIDAYKEARNWLTTKEAVERYIKSRKRSR